MNLSAITIERRCDCNRFVHSIQPTTALQDQFDNHSPKTVTHEREILQRTGPLFEERQESIQEKIDSVAERPAPIPAKDKQINAVIFAPIGKIVVRCNSRQFDAAVRNYYSILFIVVKPVRFLVHSQLESIELGMTKSPRAEPDLLIVVVKTLRRRAVGFVSCF
jgi:hypothetical protein